ncbi:hypothetical protein [Sphingosinicella microcystinivorans]|uniref:hypothetical protein n=1 Tax=Sphingosinicella microcystinivorans TaxID=335406 RepID=UPI0022F3A22C|nr:hypothetical protein [Sphingosinicella microcystinivorans]WBX85623.1 hypothetical protein PE061_06845 [Sphingosinicella microcystinivorans]
MTDTNNMGALWKAQAVRPRTLPADEIHRRHAALERRVRRRNRIEYLTAAMMFVAVAGLVLLDIRLGAFGAGTIGLILLGIGGGAAVWQLHRRTGARPAIDGARPSIDAYRDGLRRECEALASVARWYIAPFLPGMITIYTSALLKVAPGDRPLVIALAAATALLMGWVVRLNRRGAQTISAELESHDRG